MSSTEQQHFLGAVGLINAAYARRSAAALTIWPAGLRIRQLADHPGVYEMTWSFAGPDGRATFDFVTAEGEPAIRWRRIGRHAIFGDPYGTDPRFNRRQPRGGRLGPRPTAGDAGQPG